VADEPTDQDTGPPPVEDPAGAAVINPDATATEQGAGTSEEIKCVCGQVNPKGEEFCGQCGTQLIAGSVSTEVAVPEASAMDPSALEEFKLLTLPKVPINVTSSGLTHVGLQKENNEDCIFITEVSYPVHKMSVHVMIVADGMGGEPAGEVFGQMACYETWLGIRFLLPYEEQQHGFSRLDFWRYMDRQLDQHLQAQIASANSRIVRYARMKQFKAGSCGATIVVAVVICDLETGRVKIHGYNEGDARCALVIPENNGSEKFLQLSLDQTISGYPFRFLGRHDHIGGNSFNWEIWLGERELQSFWVLLYSDGLWNMLSPDSMTQAAESATNPKALCDLLLANALTVREPYGKQLGDDKVTTGDDNISIAALRCESLKES